MVLAQLSRAMHNKTTWDWVNHGIDEFVADSAELDRAYRDNRVGGYISSRSESIRSELETGEGEAVVGD